LDKALAEAVRAIPQGYAGDLVAITPIGNSGFSLSRGKKRLGLMKSSVRKRMLSVAVMDCLGVKDRDVLALDGVPWMLRTSGVRFGYYGPQGWEALYDAVAGKGTRTFYDLVDSGEG
jgi:hypothetical protein